MVFKTIIGATCACLTVLSIGANAAVITLGDLTTNDDGSTNIITDSRNNVEYLRLDVLADLTYAQTMDALATQDGGGWHIATLDEAVNFTKALLSGASDCNQSSQVGVVCGTASGWTTGILGDDFTTGSGSADAAWFLNGSGSDDVDYVSIGSSGYTKLISYGDILGTDQYAAGGTYAPNTISWLLVRPSEVPVPAAIWLFGSGLIGLIGVARRKGRI